MRGPIASVFLDIPAAEILSGAAVLRRVRYSTMLGADGSWRYDKFADRMLITGLAEFDLLDDAALDRLWLLVKTSFGFLPTGEFFRTVVCDTARFHSFHPVKDYLDNLEWDGVARLDTWLMEYGGAKDTAYVRAVGSIKLIAAVRRIRNPGLQLQEKVTGPPAGNLYTLGRLAGVRYAVIATKFRSAAK